MHNDASFTRLHIYYICTQMLKVNNPVKSGMFCMLLHGFCQKYVLVGLCKWMGAKECLSMFMYEYVLQHMRLYTE